MEAVKTERKKINKVTRKKTKNKNILSVFINLVYNIILLPVLHN